MKKIFAFIAFFAALSVNAQVSINAPTTGMDTYNACSGTIYDDGGPNGNYSNQVVSQVVLDLGSSVSYTLDISSISLASGDYIYVYSGIWGQGSYSYYTTISNATAVNTTFNMPAGPVTLYFYSSYTGNSAGVAIDFTSSITSAPTASITTAASQPYNTPITFNANFTNTLSASWDFGDGSTDTGFSPVHTYATSGTYTVTCIAQGCSQFSPDTVTKSITVATAPDLSLSDDSIYMSVPCGTTGTEYWTINNATNAGLGSFAYVVVDTNMSDFLHFEGTDHGAYDATGSPTWSISNTVSYQGSSSLRIGGGTLNDKVGVPITPSRPDEVSFHFKANSTSYRTAVTTFHEATAKNLFGSIWWESSGAIGHYYRTTSGYVTTNYSYGYTHGDWAEVSYKNIDWTSNTFDLYIDGVFQYSCQFLTVLSNLAPNYQLEEMRVLNRSSTDEGYVDNVRVGAGSTIGGLSYTPTSATLLSGNSSTVTFSYNATGMNAGVYQWLVDISSNDTTYDGVQLPFVLEITGSPDVVASADTVFFNNASVGRTYTDSIMIVNNGCAAMEIDSIKNSNAVFGTGVTNWTLEPDDTTYIAVSAQSATAGSFLDSVWLYSADSSFATYLSADFINAPVFDIADTIFYSYEGCPDSLSIPITIANPGLDTLEWQNEPQYTLYADDFEYYYAPSWWYYRGYRSAGCTPVQGYYSAVLQSYNNPIQTDGIDFSNGGTIEFDFKPSCTTPANITNNRIRIAYRTAGGSWTDLGHTYSTTVKHVKVTLPAAAQTTSTEIKIYTISYPLIGGWLVDNFEMKAFLGTDVNPVSGTVAPGDSITTTLTVATDGLLDGTYYYPLTFTSNDSVVLEKDVFVALSLDGKGQLTTNHTGCVDLDTAFTGYAKVDSITLFNDGCDSLFIDGITTSHTAWSGGAKDSALLPGDSTTLYFTFMSNTTGIFQDTMEVVYGDSTAVFCMVAEVADPPVAWVDTTTINLSTVNCGDSVNFSFDIANSGTSNLSWDVEVITGVNLLVLNMYNFPALVANYDAFLGTMDGVIVDYATTVAQLSAKIGQADMVVIPPIASNYTTAWATNVSPILSAYIIAGGTVVVMGSPVSGTFLGYQSWSNINSNSYSNTNMYAYIYSAFASDPLVDNVPQSFYTEPQAYTVYVSYGTANIDILAAGYYTSQRVLLREHVGSGEHIYCAYTMGTANGVAYTMHRNIIEDVRAKKAALGAGWAELATTTGNVVSGDTITVTGTAYSDSLNSGTYTNLIQVNTDDPSNPAHYIVVNFTVQGQGETMLADNTCLDFGSIYQNITYTDSVTIYNAGCDSLDVSGWATFGSSFITTTSTAMVGPGDSLTVGVSVLHATAGTINDSLAFYTDVDTVYQCLTATILNAPECTVTPNSLSVVINKCNNFKTETINIQNTGTGNLQIENIQIAELYDSTSTKYWNTYSSSVGHNFYNVLEVDTLWFEMEVNGGYTNNYNYFYFYVNNYYFGTFYDNDVPNAQTDVVKGYFTGNNLTNAFNSSSTNDLTIYAYRQSWTSNIGTDISKLRIYGTKPASWASVVGATTGNLIPNQSVSKNILISAANLAVGTYSSNIMVHTNDPATPIVSIPLDLEVVSQPDMELQTNLYDMGFIMGTTPVTDSVYVQNIGCNALNITSVISSNAKFVPGWTTKTIPAGNTAWLPWTFTGTASGFETGTFSIISNDTADALTVTANVVFPADANYAYNILNNCTGQVMFSNSSSNGVDYLWAFGDNTFSQDASPLHTFEKPGIYNVMLVASNAGSSDTIYQSIDLSNVLYVEAVHPDTVKINTAVNFIDSSQVPTSWQWFFGDGANSTLQNPTHTYTALGTYVVSLQVSNAAGCSTNTNNQIHVVSGIGLEENILSFGLYPNPTNGVLNFETSTHFNNLHIYDARGVQVHVGDFVDQLDVSQWPAGAYRAVLNGDDGSVSRTFIITH